MTDNTAPERIWVWPGPARGWNYGSFVPKLFNDLADPGTEYIRADLHNAALEAAKREAVEPYEQLARDVVAMIEEMSSVALLIGLEGTSDWDKVAGGVGMFATQRRARALLKEDTDQ